MGANWNNHEIIELLSARAEDEIVRQISGTVRDAVVYDRMTLMLRERGVYRSKSQIISKLKSLRRQYHHYRESDSGRQSWMYFDICQTIWGNSRSASPAAVDSNLEPECDLERTVEPESKTTQKHRTEIGANWNSHEIIELLSARAEDEIVSQISGTVRDAVVYDRITHMLRERGVYRSKSQIINKLKSLRKQYYHYRESDSGQQSWMYFDVCQTIWGNSHSASPAGVKLESSFEADSDLERTVDPESKTTQHRTEIGANWNNNEIIELLSARAEDEIVSQISGTVRDAVVYDRIADILREKSVHRSKSQIISKLKALQKQYYHYRKSDSGRQSWMYYDVCHTIWGDSRSASPTELESRLEPDSDPEGTTDSESKPSQKHRTEWNSHEIIELLSVRSEDEFVSQISGTVRDALVYERISHMLRERGVHRSKSQIIGKLKSLRKQYNDYRKSDSGQRWMYFDICQSIWGERRSASPVALESSLEPDSDLEGTANLESKKRRKHQIETATNWSYSETKELLSARAKDDIVCQISGTARDALVYDRISDILRESGIHRSKSQIIDKLKTLRAKYLQVNDHYRKTGSGRQWLYFDICQSIWGDSRSASPAHLLKPDPDSEEATSDTMDGEGSGSVQLAPNLFSEALRKQFTVPMLDLESFLSAKVKLRQEGLLDSQLKSNLEHVAQVLDAMPAVKRRDVSLLVEGERQLVKFVSGNPSLHYTVRQGSTGPELLQRVQVGPRLTRASIAKTHFAGHHCRDDFESCMERAHQVVGTSEGGLANVELKIACGELRLTYTTPQPQATIEIRPQRRVNLGKALTLEKILEVKNSMEQIGAMSRGLQACFQHLLANHSQYQGENSRIVLQSDGEMVELISGRHNYHSAQHYIFTDSDNQVQSHKVQDIDLWDDS